MTDESDFVRAIEADPNDHHLLLVFSDWLREQGDERADGYRALGVLRKSPQLGIRRTTKWGFSWVGKGEYTRYNSIARCLPGDWWNVGLRETGGMAKNFNTLTEALDTAALAFCKLSPERQQELLQQPVLN